MKNHKKLIVIGLIIALAIGAAAYFTMGEVYQGSSKIRKQFEPKVMETIGGKDSRASLKILKE